MRNRNTIAALTLGLTLGFAAQAAQPASQTEGEAAQQSPSAVVARDAATGELRAPTASEMKALQAKPMQKSVGTRSKMPRTEAEAIKTQRALRNGGVAVKVPESLMSSVVATRQADGTISINHADEAGTVHAAEQEATK